MNISINHLPRRKDIKAPNAPTKPKPKISNPTGIRPTASVFSLNVTTTSGAGGVKVGNRVGMDGELNAATKVGSISTIVVDAGVGVEGATKGGSGPAFTIFTYGA